MNRGFTLIELLVATVIVMLLTGGVIASYNNYNQTQQLRQEALTLKNDLRLIQSSAINGVDPANTFCAEQIPASVFAGYFVDFSGTGYIANGICADTTFIPSTTRQKVYATGISDIDTSTRKISFKPLTGKVDSSLIIQLQNTNNSCYAVTIETGGNIFEGPCPP